MAAVLLKPPRGKKHKPEGLGITASNTGYI